MNVRFICRALCARSLGGIELTILAAALLAIFCSGLSRIPLHMDESQWIATSRVLESVLDGDFSARTWKESYWNTTQPPMARYLVGVGRRCGGYGVDDLNVPWIGEMSREANIARGAVPSEGLLWCSRLPMGILSALAGLICVFLVARLAGRLAAYAFVVAYAGNAFFLVHLKRAMGESPLLGFLLLASLASYLGLRCVRRSASTGHRAAAVRAFAWFLLSGLFSGLAGASKLNGLAAGLIVAAACVQAVRIAAPRFGWGRSTGLAAAALVLSSCVHAGVFMAVNPYLYRDTAGRFGRMLEHRVTTMERQADRMLQSRIDNLGERVRVVPARIFQTFSFLRFPGAAAINLILCLAGVGWALRKVWVDAEGSEAGVVLLAAGLASCPPVVMTLLDWDRYYLFPVLFSTVFICVALGGIAERLCARGIGHAAESASVVGSPTVV